MLSGQWAAMYMVRRDTRPRCDWRRAFHLAVMWPIESFRTRINSIITGTIRNLFLCACA
ncbi:MAG: hypothetical protein MHM6MM_008030 [Cercozoa sp. M6MM]